MAGTVHSRRLLIATIVTAAALAASADAAAGDGAAVWRDAHCATCHTLAAAGASGTAGPNLDQVRPTAAEVVAHVLKGGGGMPSFAGLGGLPIDSLAVYVASVAGRPAGAVPRAPAPKKSAAGQRKARHAPTVVRLQEELKKLGFFHGPVTGVYGVLTAAAVRRFQASAGIRSDGVWGPVSRRALTTRLGRVAAVRRAVVRAAAAPLPPPAPWVKQLQSKLHRLGFFRHAVTGVYGPVTTAAVARFQLSAGLAVDGRWGPKSQRALVRRLSGR